MHGDYSNCCDKEILVVLAEDCGLALDPTPNQAAPVNAPIASLFHADPGWRRVTEQRRSAEGSDLSSDTRRQSRKDTMKTKRTVLSRSRSVLCLAVCLMASQAYAQTPALLDIHTYAGLTITGAVGTVYSVEYVNDLTKTNDSSVWRCLEFLQLPASPYLWTDRSAPATGQRFYRARVFPAPTNMVFIPPGTFRMGSPTNEVDRGGDEGPQTEVIISRGLLMGKHEVTQGEYLALTGDNPSYFNGDRAGKPPASYGTDLTRPVEWVSWSDATAYCAALSDREQAAGRIPTNCVYRLPTEAEWEYACRGWTSTRFSYGDDPGYTNLTNYAWYLGDSGEMTHPVEQKLPNPWGLYDMHGNVSEWCQDWFGDYPGGIAVDPQGPETGTSRVIRGGNITTWVPNAGLCRSAHRSYFSPDDRTSIIGFRAVLVPGEP